MIPKITLSRIVSSRKRFYQIALNANLFGWYEMERVYGSENNKSPTGYVREYYTNIHDALREFDKVVEQKIKKGYLPNRKV